MSMAEKVPQHIRVPNDMCKQSNLDPTDVYVYSYLKTKILMRRFRQWKLSQKMPE